MKWSWRYFKSFLAEEIIEEGHSEINPGLQVWYAYGKMMLNTTNVNYSFGRLDNVFRAAFKQLDVKDRGMQNVLLLGLGAGNVPVILQEIDPKIKVLAVEIDPEVLRLAEAHFGLVQGPQLQVVLADATIFVHECTQEFDMIVVDVFVDAEVPEAACSDAFLMRLKDLLSPSGILIFNRLAHTKNLLQQTEDFGRKMMAVLPGTQFMDADLNKVLVYEKK